MLGRVRASWHDGMRVAWYARMRVEAYTRMAGNLCFAFCIHNALCGHFAFCIHLRRVAGPSGMNTVLGRVS